MVLAVDGGHRENASPSSAEVMSMAAAPSSTTSAPVVPRWMLDCSTSRASADRCVSVADLLQPGLRRRPSWAPRAPPHGRRACRSWPPGRDPAAGPSPAPPGERACRRHGRRASNASRVRGPRASRSPDRSGTNERARSRTARRLATVSRQPCPPQRQGASPSPTRVCPISPAPASSPG